MSEQQYVDRVLAVSLDAKVLEAESMLARAEGVGVGRWPNPSVEWERQPNPTEDRVVGAQHNLVASIPLALSGRLGLEADSAARGVEAAEARRLRARSELRRDATVAFASVLAASGRRLLLEKSLSVLRGLSRIIEAREKAGDASGYDRTRIALEQATVEDHLREASLEARRAKSAALRLLGPAPTELPNFTGELAAQRTVPDTGVLGKELGKELGLRRSDLKALRLDEQSAELGKRAAGRSWVPELTVRAGALFLEGAQPGAGTGYVVGVSVPLPLFDRGQGPRALAEAKRALAAARYERLLHSAQTQLALTLDSLTTRRERLARHRTDVVARAEELRTIATAGYRGGSADLLALVDAERIARDAGLTSVTLNFEVKAAEAELFLISGAYDGVDQRSSP